MSGLALVAFCLGLILIGSHSLSSLPIQQPSNDNSSNVQLEAISFMKRFGYLAAAPEDSEALYTHDAIIRGLAKLQQFAGLYPSGTLDKDTLELLKKPRCGNADFEGQEEQRRRRRFVIGSKGWRKRRVTYHLANWSYKLGNESFVSAELKRAFQTWSDYSRLEFRPTKDYSKADMLIGFGSYYHGDNYAFDGPGLILAHAYYPYEFGHLGGDIHFDDDEPWNPKAVLTDEGLDFFTVAVHEIGHALGLAHSPVQDSIMFPYYRGVSRSFALGYDDILALYQQYISQPPVEVESQEENDELQTQVPSDDEFQTQVPAEDEATSTSPTTSPTSSATSSTSTTSTTSTTPTTSTTYSTASPSSTTGTVETSSPFLPNSDQAESSTLTFQGDYETLQEFYKRWGSMSSMDRRRTSDSVKAPDLCQVGIDAAAVIRQEIFFFKDSFLWRLTGRKQLRPEYPIHIRQMFSGLPDEVTKIDALYERPMDNRIVLFSGKKFWVSDGNDLVQRQPQPLSDLGIPNYIDHIDAAFVWIKNGRTYLFSSQLYWRFDEEQQRVEEGYPRSINVWKGLPHGINAALSWPRDGRTYFFQGANYWRFDDYLVKTEEDDPRSIDGWITCLAS